MFTVCIRCCVSTSQKYETMWVKRLSRNVTADSTWNKCFSPFLCGSLLCCVCFSRKSVIWDLTRSDSLWLSRSVSCGKKRKKKNHNIYFLSPQCLQVFVHLMHQKTIVLWSSVWGQVVMIWLEARSNAAAVMSNMFSQLEKQRSVLFSIVYVWEGERKSRRFACHKSQHIQPLCCLLLLLVLHLLFRAGHDLSSFFKIPCSLTAA